MMKTLGIIFLILIVFFIIFVIGKNVIVRITLEKLIERELGVNISMRDIDVSLFCNHIRIEDLTIYNPPGFQKKEFAFIPLINITGDPLEYFRDGHITIFFLGLNIERINIIKEEKDRVNLKEFKILERKEDARPLFSIDIFKLSLQDVYYIDYSKSSTPQTKRYNIDIQDYAFQNLNSFEDVVHLVVLKAISSTNIGKAINYTVAPLANNVKDIVFVGTRTIGDTLKGIFSLPFLFKKSQ